jgi:uncharacterized protein YecE (DUF72 family)
MEFGEFGQVSADKLDEVDFSLPETTYRGLSLLKREWDRLIGKGIRPLQKIYVGCPSWNNQEWVGKVYPERAQPRDFLKFYARQFSAIELNSTFSRIPSVSQVETWRNATPVGFKFCPKFSSGISHYSPTQMVEEQTKAFRVAVEAFGNRLGLAFLRLPPDFDLWQTHWLERFIDSLPLGFPLAVEFRHHTWFDRRSVRSAALDLLEFRGISTVITDVAGRRDVCHGSITSPKIMIRFVGNDLHRTDYQRLEAWVDRIDEWLRQGLQELYFMIHQPGEELAPELARFFIDSLNAKCGLDLPHWQPAHQAFRSRSESDVQQQLELF